MDKEKMEIKILQVETDKSIQDEFKNIIEGKVEGLYQTDDFLTAKQLFYEHKPGIFVISSDLLDEAGKIFLKDIKFFLRPFQIITVIPKEKIELISELINLEINNFIFTPFHEDNVISVIKNCAETVLLRERLEKLNTLTLDLVADLNESKKTTEKIIYEREEYKSILDCAPMGIMMLDNDYRIKYINKTFTNIFGYEKDEIPNGNTWLSLAYPDPLYKDEVIKEWSKQVEKVFFGKIEPMIFTVTCKNNATKRVNFIPVRLDTGDFILYCEDLDKYETYKSKLIIQPNIDTLTGLPNRRSLEASLREAIERAKSSQKRGSRSALIFANIDDFQQINQNFGHIAGDEVLITVAKLLKNSLRAGDSVFRFEGDEFVVLLKSTNMGEAKLAAERLQKIINEHVFIIDYTKCKLNITMGIIQIDGTMDVTTLLSNAVQTVQKSKQMGKNLIGIY